MLLNAQTRNYGDSIKDFQETYVIKHEVVQGKDKKYFRFYPADEDYKVVARLTKLQDTIGFIMKTSGTKDKRFFRYASLQFILKGLPLQLTLYQSEQLMQDSTYKNYLFLPFTDNTSGGKSYGGGRYIDLDINDIENNAVVIDFNKAYNPYCAYTSGYNCPIPPRENNLDIAIKAGEQKFKKEIKNRK
jgi:uncharacterized protein (DUF1684 family)